MAIFTTTSAVNLMLSSINEAPIADIGTTDFYLALEAQTFITTATLDLLAIGWTFNRRVITIEPDNSKHIVLPSNLLRIEQTDYCNSTTVVGGKLFDIPNNTDTFSTPVQMQILVAIDYNDLPYLAQRYVAIKAARPFQMEKVGSIEKDSVLQRDELNAITLLQTEEYKVNGSYYNMTNGDFAYNQARSNQAWYY